jgi:hypothetical protein
MMHAKENKTSLTFRKVHLILHNLEWKDN